MILSMLDTNKKSRQDNNYDDDMDESHDDLKNIIMNPKVLNILGISCSFYYTIAFVILNIYIFLDYNSSIVLDFHLFFILFLFFEVTVNWVKCFNVHKDIVFCNRCDSNGITQQPPPLPDYLKSFKICDNIKFCLFCQVDVPPRAFHCKACQVCVLRRNHHCYLTGRCVGFSTKRRYVVLCFYASIACFYTAWNIAWYLSSHYIRLSPVTYHLLNYIPPVPFITVFFSKTVTVFFDFLLVNFYMYLVLSLLAFVNCGFHVILTYTGQTSYEGFKLIRRYQRDVRYNCASVFGNWFLIHFIWPVETAIFGDGYHWPLK